MSDCTTYVQYQATTSTGASAKCRARIDRLQPGMLLKVAMNCCCYPCLLAWSDNLHIVELATRS